MFLKHRNTITAIILLLASLLWIWGQELVDMNGEQFLMETTYSVIESTISPIEETTSIEDTSPTEETYVASTVTEETYGASTVAEEMESEFSETTDRRNPYRGRGLFLCGMAFVLAVLGIFVLPQRKAVLGPDGVIALWFFGGWWLIRNIYSGIIRYDVLMIIGRYGLLLFIREFWGWILEKCTLERCVLRRLTGRVKGEGYVLLLYLSWGLGTILGLLGYLVSLNGKHEVILLMGILNVALSLFFLIRYAMELQHFKKQLDAFAQGKPIVIRKGTFGQTEEQLLSIGKEHKEAVETAVKSERFKVELISNVSHDLRTPLTAILGYSEILQKEDMSLQGKEQLSRLFEKASYMNELVESLFELTKVSSGVVECKKEPIDLVRLLEQTVGFYDEALQRNDLVVRRRYEREHLPIIADGGRLHQVFANLLGNAIKYALPGTRIYMELVENENSAELRMVNTANYEMDFSEEEILQRFARGDKARSTGGSGLGLAIAQTYTEAMGGNFRVKVDGDQFNAIVTLRKN